jgi:hypothetical protein
MRNYVLFWQGEISATDPTAPDPTQQVFFYTFKAGDQETADIIAQSVVSGLDPSWQVSTVISGPLYWILNKEKLIEMLQVNVISPGPLGDNPKNDLVVAESPRKKWSHGR